MFLICCDRGWPAGTRNNISFHGRALIRVFLRHYHSLLEMPAVTNPGNLASLLMIIFAFRLNHHTTAEPIVIVHRMLTIASYRRKVENSWRVGAARIRWPSAYVFSRSMSKNLCHTSASRHMLNAVDEAMSVMKRRVFIFIASSSDYRHHSIASHRRQISDL